MADLKFKKLKCSSHICDHNPYIFQLTYLEKYILDCVLYIHLVEWFYM